MKTKTILLGLCIVLLGATFSGADPTEITVRVKTKDAKFLGTSMGGALISIKDAQTGELLAKGLTTGGTGNKTRIMKTPVVRGVPISDESAAKFTATIDINEPRRIEVTAYGPMVNLQAANKVSATQWGRYYYSQCGDDVRMPNHARWHVGCKQDRSRGAAKAKRQTGRCPAHAVRWNPEPVYRHMEHQRSRPVRNYRVCLRCFQWQYGC